MKHKPYKVQVSITTTTLKPPALPAHVPFCSHLDKQGVGGAQGLFSLTLHSSPQQPPSCRRKYMAYHESPHQTPWLFHNRSWKSLIEFWRQHCGDCLGEWLQLRWALAPLYKDQMVSTMGQTSGLRHICSRVPPCQSTCIALHPGAWPLLLAFPRITCQLTYSETWPLEVLEWEVGKAIVSLQPTAAAPFHHPGSPWQAHCYQVLQVKLISGLQEHHLFPFPSRLRGEVLPVVASLWVASLLPIWRFIFFCHLCNKLSALTLLFQVVVMVSAFLVGLDWYNDIIMTFIQERLYT